MPMTPEKLEAVRRSRQAEADRIKAAQDREAARKAAYDQMVQQAKQSNDYASAKRKINALSMPLRLQSFLEAGDNPATSSWFQYHTQRGIKPVPLTTTPNLTADERLALQRNISESPRNWQSFTSQLPNIVGGNNPLARNQKQFYGFDPNEFRPQELSVSQQPQRPVAGPGRTVAQQTTPKLLKTGGSVKGYAKGGSVTRGDGCAQRGKTKGKMR